MDIIGIVQFKDREAYEAALSTTLQVFGMVIVPKKPPSRTCPVSLKTVVSVHNIPIAMTRVMLQAELARALRKSDPAFDVSLKMR